ncbi:C40 family peptidase [Mobilitalea sibirica]|uniref:C40 family peptidase n=1 Tax=Mobilitalea sibirica TaxID=1462919 RepID=A0A8J7KUF7_9FIRM|nr:C40 family peptidase [Mobilitalea sibirica]MBH1942441.1 C40 family peptidase [Mobilitalea sibirica]
MRKNKAIRTAVFISSAVLFLSIPAVPALADHTDPIEQGVAGMARTLETYHAWEINNKEQAEDKSLIKILRSDIISPYANLGVSKADNYVNIRKEPSTESEIVGKLYRGCAADILEWLEGDWVKIQSGDVEGYIASNYLATGRDAEAMFDEYATKYATVTTQTLFVREEQSTDSKILEMIPGGETYIVIKEYDDWAEILLGADNEGRDFTGYVSKDYIDIDVEFKYAISIEEELRIKAEQEAAERAEAERLRKLAEEEARRKEEERRAAEAAKKAAEAAKRNEQKQEQTKPSTSDSGSLSDIRSEVATYAQKFVGNPYVWGGTSLTRGADCSGFVQTIYRQFGYSIPRVSRDQAVSAGIKVNIGDRKPGDLIFYTNSSGVVNHVAMYIGNDKIVHAANSRQGIIISKYDYRKIYRIRRVIH